MVAEIPRDTVKLNLWSYLRSKEAANKENVVDKVFKTKSPKRYIQVKTSLANYG